jgi:hypothetical protein
MLRRVGLLRIRITAQNAGGPDMAQEPSRPLKIVLWRRRAENPTLRYDEVARRRVTLVARRRGGPALEVGTGPCACMAKETTETVLNRIKAALEGREQPQSPAEPQLAKP